MGPKTMMQTLKTIDDMLTVRRAEIAAVLARDGEVSITMGLKFKARSSAVDVDVKLAFYKDRVSDLEQITVDEKQLELFGGGDAV